MSCSRRLQKELEDLQNNAKSYFTNVRVDESNFLQWQGLVVPSSPPYNKGAFLIEITFPPEYPFKPPQVMFKTKIYHPNVGEKGQICLPMLTPEHWKPSTKMDQVVEALVAMVNSPQLDHPLRPDLAQEYAQNQKKFFKVAEKLTAKFSEKRPKNQ